MARLSRPLDSANDLFSVQGYRSKSSLLWRVESKADLPTWTDLEVVSEANGQSPEHYNSFHFADIAVHGMCVKTNHWCWVQHDGPEAFTLAFIVDLRKLDNTLGTIFLCLCWGAYVENNTYCKSEADHLVCLTSTFAMAALSSIASEAGPTPVDHLTHETDNENNRLELRSDLWLRQSKAGNSIPKVRSVEW